jgi:phage/conjugal plasmid C-4 type zinc finger TraR family protein
VDEKYLEQASAITEHLITDGSTAIHKALSGNGQADCEDCGELISPARRKAIPSCIRCIDCQTNFELTQKGYQE